MRRIYVCGPLGGAIKENVARMIKAVSTLKTETAFTGESPLFLVPHFVLNNITFDFAGEIDRRWGMKCCLEMVEMCEELIVIGKEVTAGMKEEIELARQLGKKVIHRVEL